MIKFHQNFDFLLTCIHKIFELTLKNDRKIIQALWALQFLLQKFKFSTVFAKGVMSNMHRDELDCVPIKLYLYNQSMGQIQPPGNSLSTLFHTLLKLSFSSTEHSEFLLSVCIYSLNGLGKYFDQLKISVIWFLEVPTLLKEVME